LVGDGVCVLVIQWQPSSATPFGHWPFGTHGGVGFGVGDTGAGMGVSGTGTSLGPHNLKFAAL
jgi:hypothetical protein